MLFKVRIYIWFGKPGHVSMEIIEETESIYVSFWPFHRKKKNMIESFRNRKSSVMPESYYEESHLESEYIGRQADETILLKNLPNPKHLRIKSFRVYWENKSWQLIGRNCCYVVIDNLEDLSGVPRPNSILPFTYSVSDVAAYSHQLEWLFG